MTVVSLVYAQSRNGVIGDAGGLPWHIPSDLKRFKEITLGKPVIMGRKTWDSLPRKPLPGRPNIVLTRQKNFHADGATVVESLEDAISTAGNVEEVCIIGGGEIYRQFLPLATRIYLTVVDVDVAGDTPAPQLDLSHWRVVWELPGRQGDKDSAHFTTRLLERER